MADKTRNAEEAEDDYMADISLFLPPNSSPQRSSSQPTQSSKPKKSKSLNWQQQLKIDRKRKQQAEDQLTKASLEAPIPSSNVGFKMLKMMGYTPGSALGKDGGGLAEPVGLEIRRSRAGIGVEEETKRRERDLRERARRSEEVMVEEFGDRQKSQWRIRRVVADYRKAEAALAQLENKEEIPKVEDGEDLEGAEEEEEVITEENLHDILVKLRDEYQYCLYCGYQYESADALSTNCPGLSEDDH